MEVKNTYLPAEKYVWKKLCWWRSTLGGYVLIDVTDQRILGQVYKYGGFWRGGRTTFGHTTFQAAAESLERAVLEDVFGN